MLAAILGIDGSSDLMALEGKRVVLARGLGRPMQYFLAKPADGPVLIVAEPPLSIYVLSRLYRSN